MTRSFVIAAALVLLTVPAFAQSNNLINNVAGAGKADRAAKGEGGDDPAKAKVDEKAFKDAVGRIPGSEKKYDPWGTIRASGTKLPGTRPHDPAT